MLRLPGEPGKGKDTKRKRLDVLAGQLKIARQTFEPHWKELAEYFRPRRLRLIASDRNKGDKRSQKILDSTTVFAARTLASGIMANITSPVRVWFKAAITDRALMEKPNVKAWLDEVRDGMIGVLARSNFYEVLPTYYSDLGVFGTSAMIVEEDDEKVIRCTHFALGEYWIGYNSKQQVRVFMREFELTVRQIVEQFGVKHGDGYKTDNLSIEVQNAWRTGNTEQGINVIHFITENGDYDQKRLAAKHKAYSSCYYETASRHDVFLNEGGYEEWPVMAVRWEGVSGDVYATDCPGMTALGDAKELMFSKKLGGQALNKAVNPPLVGHVDFRQSAISLLPGGMSWVAETADKKIRPLVDTSQFRLDYLATWITELKALIERSFFVDMFLLIANIDRGDVTATEVLEKKEEKLLTLGPVGKQIDGGFLDPFFDRLYGIMMRRGMIPQPPPEMEGVSFHLEYESITAQAQRAQGRQGIDTFAMFLMNAAKEDPTILDIADTKEMVKRYSEVTGVPANFIRSDEAIQALQDARAKAQQQQAEVENTKTMADSAHKLAGASTEGKNALTDLMGGNE